MTKEAASVGGLFHVGMLARNVSPGTERLFPKLGVHRLRHQLTGGSRP